MNSRCAAVVLDALSSCFQSFRKAPVIRNNFLGVEIESAYLDPENINSYSDSVALCFSLGYRGTVGSKEPPQCAKEKVEAVGNGSFETAHHIDIFPFPLDEKRNYTYSKHIVASHMFHYC